ncbi:MAG: hypothetical protein KDK99_21105 [Verrucomicrobiales bacterium]|nr:hypothetical protein [Verrucomicrobiales bacterium]
MPDFTASIVSGSALLMGGHGSFPNAGTEEPLAGYLFVTVFMTIFFVMLAFLFGCGWTIWRRTTRPHPHHQLLMELADEDSSTSAPEVKTVGSGPNSAPEAEPWEKPADWWRETK